MKVVNRKILSERFIENGNNECQHGTFECSAGAHNCLIYIFDAPITRICFSDFVSLLLCTICKCGCDWSNSCQYQFCECLDLRDCYSCRRQGRLGLQQSRWIKTGSTTTVVCRLGNSNQDSRQGCGRWKGVSNPGPTEFVNLKIPYVLEREVVVGIFAS